MDDLSYAFKEREVLYKNIKHPEISEGDRCLVAVDSHTKCRAEIICVRQYRVAGNFEFLVHFDHLPDRRYDAWVDRACISDIEKAVEKQTEAADSEGEGPAKRARRARKKPMPLDQQPNVFSKLSLEEELKQYDDFTKRKLINEVHVGRYVISTWYFSPFPKELTKYPRIHICPMCLSQFVLEDTYGYHYNNCKTAQPPGHKLYDTEDLAIFEVDPKDGDDQMLYCQLLSLLGKCFIKEKTLVFYVGDFRFYVLCEKRRSGSGVERYEVVGYFSKEKMSEENYNLACLVVLPPYMNKGYGFLLIDMSYVITRHDKRLGTPERPLSKMGRKAYLNYWSFTVVKGLMRYQERFRISFLQQKDDYKIFNVPLDLIARDTALQIDDIREALQSLRLPGNLIADCDLIFSPVVLRGIYEKLLMKYTAKGLDGPLLVNTELVVWPEKKTTRGLKT